MKTILIIEDEPAIRESICDLLEIEGFSVIDAELGHKGVQIAEERLPDLILCDVNLPDTDGYEILTTLQKNPVVKTIPFIFLTAKGTKADLRHGMNLGADDYLVKPCSAEELLGAIAIRMDRQDTLRTQSQQQLDVLRNNIALFLPHELHTPLNSILLFSEILVDEYASIPRNDILEISKGIHGSAERLYRLIQNFLCYAQLEIAAHDPERRVALCMGETNLSDVRITEVATRLARQANREADLSLQLQNANLNMSDNRLQKIMEELIENAFKFSNSGSPVEITSKTTDQGYRVNITDWGRGMTAEQIANLGAYMQFDRRFYEQQGSGLGLIIAKRMLELHGGQMQIDSTLGQQTTIQLTIPLASSTSELLSAA
ncbi:MAG: response regulator [Leptolyngbyaceae cyanobacterium CRU_2_3]|nr:response regulator [Leptolyngbyaceae cyanobacterium CRU_2_3]